MLIRTKYYALIQSDRQRTARKMAETFEINQLKMIRRLRKLGMVSKADEWVPHELTEKILIDEISACDS